MPRHALRFTRRVVSAAVLTVTIPAVAGCSSTSPEAAKEPAPASATPPHPGSAVASPVEGVPDIGGATVEPGRADISPRSCHGTDLRATVQVNQEGSGRLLLSNEGRTACSVSAVPHFGGVFSGGTGPKDEVHKVPVRLPSGAATSGHRTLQPSATAHATLRWKACEAGSSGCYAFVAVAVAPSDRTVPLTAPVTARHGEPLPRRVTVSSAGFTIGTLRSGRG